MEPVGQRIHKNREESLPVPFRTTAHRSRRARELLRAHGEAGFMSVSGILLILVVAAILFAAFKLLPPYIDNYRLQDSIETIARNSTYNGAITASDIRKQVMAEIREIGIPVEENQVVVQRTGVTVNIAIRYSITVDLLVQQVVLNFEPAAGNRNILTKP